MLADIGGGAEVLTVGAPLISEEVVEIVEKTKHTFLKRSSRSKVTTTKKRERNDNKAENNWFEDAGYSVSTSFAM